jgi:hypothetical protein
VSFDLVDALRAALDDGAAWLYACAYDAICPQRDSLAARITDLAAWSDSGAARGARRRDRRLDIRGTLTARSRDRRDLQTGSSSTRA